MAITSRQEDHPSNQPRVNDLRKELYVSYKVTEKSLIVAIFHSRGFIIPGLKERDQLIVLKNDDPTLHQQLVSDTVQETIAACLDDPKIAKGKGLENIIFVGDVNLGFSGPYYPNSLLNNDLDNTFSNYKFYKVMTSGTKAYVNEADRQFTGDRSRAKLGVKGELLFKKEIDAFDGLNKEKKPKNEGAAKDEDAAAVRNEDAAGLPIEAAIKPEVVVSLQNLSLLSAPRSSQNPKAQSPKQAPATNTIGDDISEAETADTDRVVQGCINNPMG